MTAPNLMSYTTTVPANKTIGEVQMLLLKFGATRTGFFNEYFRVVGVCFEIMTSQGLQTYRLPTDWHQVHEYLWQQYTPGRARVKKQKKDFTDQAFNVAWRIIRNWLHAQLSMIEIGQTKAEIVFLPYLIVGKDRTLGQVFLEGGLRNYLPSGEKPIPLEGEWH